MSSSRLPQATSDDDDDDEIEHNFNKTIKIILSDSINKGQI